MKLIYLILVQRSNQLSYQANWELYIYFFIPQFKYMSFIYSQFHLHLSRVYYEPIYDQLPVGLIAQLVRALHRYRRGQGSNPGKPDFFRLSFRNCISCVNNCEDLLYIYLFLFVCLFLCLFVFVGLFNCFVLLFGKREG